MIGLLSGMDSQRRLSLAFGITVTILAGELIGGLISNSIALISDAGHVFTDSFALGLSLIASRISRLPTDRRATFGYHRVGLLAAVINGASLVVIAAYIFYESYGRFLAPPGVELSVMLPVAAAGLAANVLMIVVLGHGHTDLNIRSAWLHVVGDTLSSVGVIAAGLVMYFTGWAYADPIAGFMVGAIIVTGGLRVAREAIFIFLDLVPRGFSVEEVAREVRSVPGVLDVHDVHLRSLTHGRVNFTAHVRVKDQSLCEAEAIRKEVEHRLEHMGIVHTVIQLECAECSEEGLFCRVHSEDLPEKPLHFH